MPRGHRSVSNTINMSLRGLENILPLFTLSKYFLPAFEKECFNAPGNGVQNYAPGKGWQNLPPANSSPMKARITNFYGKWSSYRSLSRAILVTPSQYPREKNPSFKIFLKFCRKCMSLVFQL